MGNIISILQGIQDNLVGIVLPVLITAFVSIISILANAVIQIILRNSNINSEQYKLMQEFYPKMKLNLLEMKLGMREVKSNPLYKDMQNAIKKYIEYKKDDANYIKNNESEIQYIDQFIASMDNYSNKTVLITEHFVNSTIPKPPVMHFVLKSKVNKMLSVIWYYSLLWNKYNSKLISTRIFLEEIQDFKKNWNEEITYEKIEEYICLLDKWLLKY